MPLNEAAGFRKVGLNREQRHAQEAAIYGVEVSQQQITLSHDEAERLRALLTQHDKQSMPKQFDLNAPPKEPYRYQEFPCVIYDHEARTAKIVHSAEERAEWLEVGYRREPFPPEQGEKLVDGLIRSVAEASLDPDEAAEVANVDRVLGAKRGPGRPRKIEASA